MTFEQDWRRWHEARVRYAAAEYGPAALESTNWLIAMPAAVDGIPGLWALARDGGIEGSELGVAGRTIALKGAESIRFGRREVRVFERDGALALRVFDPQRAQRELLSGIDAYKPDAAWQLPATFEATPDEQIVLRTTDGHERTVALAGRLRFELRGAARVLLATRRDNGALTAVFGDVTNGIETYRFRFLPIDEPDADGTAVLDFNRAYLPPCAFSDQFFCPVPPEANRYPVPIRAGERAVLLGG